MTRRKSEVKAPTGRSKAQQAARNQKETTAVRNQLLIRLIVAVLLAFWALFLILSFWGIHAALLDIFRTFARGVFGYGYWPLPFALGFIAWILVFQNHKPFRLRSVSLLLVVILFSSLLHILLCKTTFSGGFALIAGLWRTGVEGVSGGVIPGLLGEFLVFLISKGGAIPLLIVLLIVFFFLSFQISAAMLIHNRAEKRREKLQAQELDVDDVSEPPVILTQDITMDDLRVLATPTARPRQQRRKPQNFDVSINDDAPNSRFSDYDSAQEGADEDLVFFRKSRKNRVQKQVSQRSSFDLPVGEDYAAAVQKLAQTPAPESGKTASPWDIPVSEPTCPSVCPADLESPQSSPSLLTEEEIAEAAETAKQNEKVSPDEAAIAAAEVAKEIEILEDAEVQEAPPYQYPPMTMLSEALGAKADNTEEMRTNVIRLENTLGSFGVDIKIENVVRGPTVTRYEMELKPGIKMNKITSLHEDIALALGVSGIRVAAVPGKNSIIGIEVPNKITTSVPIREVLSSKEFQNHKSTLAFAVGKDIGGNYIIGDIAKMPHLLIAGTTGSGKSVCMNSIIVSLLYRTSPKECRMIMIDPKVVELSIYNGIPHLLIPVVTDAKKAAGALQWAVTEMERRYRLLADYKVRDLSGYNKLAKRNPDMMPMPQIVIIIDELADLMLVASKEVENSIIRIGQKARAAGMYLVIATQRPSADVITGIMKANIPSRIAFAVSSAIDSRIILDESGAEKLVGKGDMLYAPLGAGKTTRVQGCFITDEEAEEIADFVKNSSKADYSDEILQEIEQNASAAGKPETDSNQTAIQLNGDELLPEAVEVILDTKQASVSMLQRRLKLGYAHAARIVDELEEKGIVGHFEGSKPRQLLITREQWDTMVGLNPRAVAPSADDSTAPDDDVPFDEDE